MTDLHALLNASALEQARAIRDGEITSEALTRFYVDRIAAHDRHYGAFVSLGADEALEAARAKDRDRPARGALPAFYGVPTGVKDLHAVRGTRTQMGSRAFRWVRTPFDDVTAAAVRRGGFVILGKTATSELGLLPICETDIHPPTRNAWNPRYTAGGSSGGAGAAVGAGLVPIAPGSDGAGSIRIPAALNGLFGHKPSRGRVPNPADKLDRYKMTTMGPLARNVDDAAALLDVLVGRDPHRPGSFLSAARAGTPRLRIGLIVDAPIVDTDDEAAAAAREAAAVLAREGHHVTEGTPRHASLDAFLPVYQRLLAAIPVASERRLQPVTRWFRAEGRRHPRRDVDAAFAELSALAASAIDGFDVIITPTIPVLPPRVGEHNGLGPAEYFRALAGLGAFTAASNLTGAPAATVPWSVSRQGTPLGVQIIARPGEDERVLALSRELEQARGGPFRAVTARRRRLGDQMPPLPSPEPPPSPNRL